METVFLDEIKDKLSRFQFDEAELWAELFCQQFGSCEVTNFALGFVYKSQSKYSAASHFFAKCSSVHAVYLLGSCLYHTSHFANAIKSLLSILELGHTFDEATYFGFHLCRADILKLLGQSYIALGDVLEGSKYAAKGFFSNSKLLNCYFDALRISLEGKERICLEREFKETMTTFLNHGKIFSYNVESAPKKQRLNKTLSVKNDILSITDTISNFFQGFYSNFQLPTSPFVQYFAAMKASSLYECSMYYESAIVYRNLLQWNPFYSCSLIENYPAVLWHLKDKDSLKFWSQKWSDEPHTRFLSAIALGNLLSLNDDRDAAMLAFRRASEYNHLSPLPNLLCAYEYLMIEDYQSAGEQFTTAISKDPNNGKARLGLGIVFFRQNDLQLAITHLNASIKLRPEDPSAYIYLASALQRKDDNQNALSVINDVLKIHPHEKKGLYLKAVILIENSQYEAASESLEKLRSLVPVEPSIYEAMSRIHLKQRKPLEYIKSISMVNDLDPGNTKIIDSLDKLTGRK